MDYSTVFAVIGFVVVVLGLPSLFKGIALSKAISNNGPFPGGGTLDDARAKLLKMSRTIYAFGAVSAAAFLCSFFLEK